MKRFFSPVFLAAVLLCGSAAALTPPLSAQTTPPSVRISNGAMTATVYLPDAGSGYYRGTRFDWAGVIGQLESAKHVFYSPWFTKTDASVRDFVNDGTDITAGPQTAITGPAEEFSVLGFADAAAGGTFVKIGVGALRKPTDGSAYSAFRSYEIADPGKRTVVTHPDGAEFTHELADAGGYAYRYTKALHLAAGRPELTITHRLVNTGTKPIAGNVYNHNFLTLDRQTPGPDVSITTPFDLETAQPLDPALGTISGREFRYAAPISDRGRVAAQFAGFGPTAADYHFTIENHRTGAGVEMTGDRPLDRLALWSIRSVLALEPFITFDIAPGATFTWTYTYRYYTVP